MGNKRLASEPSMKTPKRQKKESALTEPRNGNTTNNGLIVLAQPDWHAIELPTLKIIESPKAPSGTTIKALQDHATALLENDNIRYATLNASKNSSIKFMKEIASSGTLEDKVSALTLVVQESPLHNMKAFESLLNLAKKKSRNQAIMALGALKDLLGAGVVLPPDRKLRAFGRQPALLSALQGRSATWKEGDSLPSGIKEEHLVFWAYEDWLKHTYFEVLKTLESWSNDEVAYARNRAVTFVWELLKEKPEQEENLLRLLVNKLGDTDKKVASRASHLLLQLQLAHPAMRGIIIGAIEADLLFRPGQNMHAKYYAIITLNQTILSQKEPDVAVKLLDIYFTLFVSMLKGDASSDDTLKSIPDTRSQGGGGKPGKKALQKQKLKDAANEAEIQLKDRLIAQLLTGINRAYPYSDTQSKTVEMHLDTLYRVTHSSNFNTGIQALMLIYQISIARQEFADRYYRSLYESLLDPRLLSSSKQVMYLNLLYRSLKADVNVKRVKAFVKRLLQVITLHEPPFACGVLFLIRELQTTFPSLQSMLSDPEALAEDEQEVYVDAPEEDENDSKMIEPRQYSPKDLYNPRKREPEFSNAERSCLWELNPLVAHYHPSVSLFASRLLQSEAFDKQKPDPTTFTLIHFLDRFIYRNARGKASGLRGSSLMQPLAGSTAADHLIKDRASGRYEEALNNEMFWSKKRDDVRADEVFFHDYFAKAGKAQKKSRAEKRAERGDQYEESTADEQEGEIWKALVGSRPEIEDKAEFEEDEDDLDIAEFMEDEGDEMESENDNEEDGGVKIDGFGDVAFHGFDEDDNEDGEKETAFGKSKPLAAPDAKLSDAKLSDDDFDFADLDDGDQTAFVDSDEEIPDNVAIPEAPSMEEFAKDIKSKDKRKRKRSLKSLPVFASAEDYAKLLGEDDEDL